MPGNSTIISGNNVSPVSVGIQLGLVRVLGDLALQISSSSGFWDAMNMKVTLSSIPDPTHIFLTTWLTRQMSVSVFDIFISLIDVFP